MTHHFHPIRRYWLAKTVLLLILVAVLGLWSRVFAGPLLLATEGHITVGLLNDFAQVDVSGANFHLLTGPESGAHFLLHPNNQGISFRRDTPLPITVTMGTAGSFEGPGVKPCCAPPTTWFGELALTPTGSVTFVESAFSISASGPTFATGSVTLNTFLGPGNVSQDVFPLRGVGLLSATYRLFGGNTDFNTAQFVGASMQFTFPPTTPNGPLPAIPEPGTLGLFVLGVVIFGVARNVRQIRLQ